MNAIRSSCLVQQQADRARRPPVLRHLGVELPRPLAVMRYSRTCRPDSDSRHAAFTQPLIEQLLECGVERALFNTELLVRQMMDVLSNRVAVQRLPRSAPAARAS